MEANLLAAEGTPLVADRRRAHGRERARSSAADATERPVFYSPSGVRRRLVRAAARALALLASLWLIALVVSALGVRPLGELGLPFGLSVGSRAHGDRAADRVSAPGRLGLPSAIGAGSVSADAGSRGGAHAAGNAFGHNTSSGPGGEPGTSTTAGRSHGHAGGGSSHGPGGGGGTSPTPSPPANPGAQGAPQTVGGAPPAGSGAGGSTGNAGGGSSQPASAQPHPVHPAHPAHPASGRPSTAGSGSSTPHGHGGRST